MQLAVAPSYFEFFGLRRHGFALEKTSKSIVRRRFQSTLSGGIAAAMALICFGVTSLDSRSVGYVCHVPHVLLATAKF